MIRAAIAIISVFLLAGCNRDAPSESNAATQSIKLGDLSIALSTDRVELTTVDRLTLTLAATYPLDTPYTPDPAYLDALEAAGWTVVSSRVEPPRAAGDGRLVRTSIATLEPWLPGDYEIPGFEVTWNDLSAAVDPIAVTVTPLLADDDPLAESAELTELRDAPEASDSPRVLIVVVGAAVVLGAVAAVTFVRGGRRDRDFDPADAFRAAERTARRIADSSEVSREDLDRLAEAVRTAERLGAPGGGEVIRRLEIARFSPTPPSAVDRAAIARDVEAYVRTAHDVFRVEHRGGGAHR